ncbi:GtrA family protein [Frankia sp. CNm7]|uniref:GtrA family protein n=1 Tax=Frankia nepalensis TaxID=1836974 RepID=A0A937RL81_9ACTN|nr:GtrA family protein [Frankia nepalensis]MBL7495080.1 GtrA family protein [Frankia nepalensis]MBL7513172.1 GtrA family protein [Frankia nepalensis]MBL7524511.1 GtrA family protein [Frankia nepalensis]MBL7632315.1 GtrA family protein [Frankia nepalensis]
MTELAAGPERGPSFLRRNAPTFLRLFRFGCVGTSCAVFQFAVLKAVELLGAQPSAAYAAGFACSAQVNFLLSSTFTWRDRTRELAGPRRWLRRWLGFNAGTLASLLVSTVVFTLVVGRFGDLLAMVIGIASGMIVSYSIGDRVVFARSRGAGERDFADVSGLIPAARRPDRQPRVGDHA